MNKREIGAMGETAVCRYLEERGYTILERNFTAARVGEIDIIASKGEELHFVEVKSRKIGSMVSGVESVTLRKQKRIIATTYYYFQKRDTYESDWYIRYDIATVNLWKGRVIDIDYLEAAFDETDIDLSDVSWY